MVMDYFLQHAQVRMNDEMNKYIQTGVRAADQTRVDGLDKSDGKLFKKTRRMEIRIPQTTTSPPIGYDILELDKEGYARYRVLTIEGL